MRVVLEMNHLKFNTNIQILDKKTKDKNYSVLNFWQIMLWIVIILAIMGACLLFVSVVYFMKIRMIGEVKYLPKLMTILSIFSWVLYIVHYIQQLVGINDSLALSIVSLQAKLPMIMGNIG